MYLNAKYKLVIKQATLHYTFLDNTQEYNAGLVKQWIYCLIDLPSPPVGYMIQKSYSRTQVDGQKTADRFYKKIHTFHMPQSLGNAPVLQSPFPASSSSDPDP